MTRVVVLEDYLDYVRHLPSLQALAERAAIHIHTMKAASEAETISRLRQADMVITIRDRVVYTAGILAHMGHIQLLSVCGSRLSHIDLDAATRHGVLVCAPPAVEDGSPTKTATAEQTWNLILGLVKDTAMNDRGMHQGHWQTRPARDLAGKTLGLLGLGAIAQQVAQIGKAMRMRVIAWSPHLTPERAHAHGAEAVAFERLFMESDILSVHAPLLPDNHNLIGESELALMPPHAYMVNTARAALVNEQALRQALERGSIAGAGFDVYWEEPLPTDHWLRQLDNVLLQPHLGGFTDVGYDSLVRPAVENVLAFLDGNPQHLVNPEVLEQRRRLRQ
jgi:phosphoglycerate dehydrogenase-like enzyme